MASLSGGCLCKSVRYEISKDPAKCIVCYCRDCQQISGGGHLPLFIVQSEDVSITGNTKTYVIENEFKVDVAFCPECGSPLYKKTERHPELTIFVAGSLDEPSSYQVDERIWTDSKQDWDN